MEGLIIGGSFAFQNGLGLTKKKLLETLRQQSKLKQLTLTCMAYIREGLLSEVELCLLYLGRFIFGKAYCQNFRYVNSDEYS